MWLVPKLTNLVKTGAPVAPTPANAIVFLLLDISWSMNGEEIVEAKAGAVDFAHQAIHQGYLVGVIAFGSDAHYIHDPTTDLASLQTAIAALVPYGGNNEVAALRMADECFVDTAPDVPAVVFLTDGRATDPDEALATAAILKEKGVRIITIGTAGADLDFLRRLASHPDLAEVVAVDTLSNSLMEASEKLSLPPRVKVLL